jgi:hypothetical protein
MYTGSRIIWMDFCADTRDREATIKQITIKSAAPTRDLILNSVRYRTNLKHQPDQGRATTGAHDAPPAPCRVDASAAIIVHTYEPLPFR